MAKIKAEIQGMDTDFRFTGSYDAIELGEVTLGRAQELMRKLPDEEGVTSEFSGKGDECPPNLILRSRQMVKKGLIKKKWKEEDVYLSLSGGLERGKVSAYENDTDLGEVSFAEADEIIGDFFRKASEEPAFPADL